MNVDVVNEFMSIRTNTYAHASCVRWLLAILQSDQFDYHSSSRSNLFCLGDALRVTCGPKIMCVLNIFVYDWSGSNEARRIHSLEGSTRIHEQSE